MKKHILKLGFALAVVVATGYTVYFSQTSLKMTGIALNNVEALVSGEDAGFNCWWNGDNYDECTPSGRYTGCPCGSHNW